MKPSLLAKLQQLDERLVAVDRLLAAPETANQMSEFRKLSKERADLALKEFAAQQVC
jgi:peptide chain release factor 1